MLTTLTVPRSPPMCTSIMVSVWRPKSSWPALSRRRSLADKPDRSSDPTTRMFVGPPVHTGDPPMPLNTLTCDSPDRYRSLAAHPVTLTMSTRAEATATRVRPMRERATRHPFVLDDPPRPG